MACRVMQIRTVEITLQGSQTNHKDREVEAIFGEVLISSVGKIEISINVKI